MKAFIILMVSFAMNLMGYGKELALMSYNLENLFDAIHTKNGEVEFLDFEYLPITDKNKSLACNKLKQKSKIMHCQKTNWTSEKLSWKLKNISRVIKNANVYPDILGVVEVENSTVISKLAYTLGYRNFIFAKDHDPRGLSLGFLYNEKSDLKLLSSREWKIPTDYPTRSIFEVHFKLSNMKKLVIILNHWPSKMSSDSNRELAAKILGDCLDHLSKTDPETPVIVMGDFNICGDEFNNPLKKFISGPSELMDLNSENIGTYFSSFDNKWCTFDHIFIKRASFKNLNFKYIPKSFEVYKKSFFLKKKWASVGKGYLKEKRFFEVPKRFNPNAKIQSSQGYSDHFPIQMRLKY
jgi:exonuclease III